MRLARIFCAALVFVSAAVAADDFEQLRDDVARGDYSAAVPALQAAAEHDDPRALSLLASLYQQGQGFPHDAAKALELYTRAAELGDAEAQFNLGNIYLLGDGVKADEAWALTYYRQAAAQGHEGAARNLEELYRASGLSPAPMTSSPPARPLPDEVARLHAEPAVAPVPAIKSESLAPGMSAAANPPVPGAVARDITARRAQTTAPTHGPVAAKPLTSPAPQPATPAPSPAPNPSSPSEVAPDAPSQDELRAIELARASGVEVRMDGAGAALPHLVNLPRPASLSLKEDGKPAFTPSSASTDPDTVENTEEGESAYASAQRYLHGQGVALDPAMGAQWLERAARAGHTQAKYELALHFLKGEGVQADEAMAITLLRDAAQAGHPQAAAKLQAVYAAAGLPMPALAPPQPRAAPVLEPTHRSSTMPASRNADAVAATTSSDAPISAATHTDHEPAFERGEQNATRGAMTGMMADAAAEEDQERAEGASTTSGETPTHQATSDAASPVPSQSTDSVVKQPATSAHVIERSGTAGLADARAALDAQDLARAATLFTALAERGDAEAQAHIGYMTYRGEGVAADKAKAVAWYRKAAAQGNRDAQYNLAVAYAFGEGVAQNDAEALLWYHRAAEQGSAVAQYSLGVSYALGEGVPRNDVEAVKWYRAAADHGYADAQYNLGQMIRAGRGVSASESEAMRWFKQAADSGSAAAQYKLGNMYRSGTGVGRDLNEAIRWYKLAAAQGHNEARADLAALQSQRSGSSE